jgi:hypothetical protein
MENYEFNVAPTVFFRKGKEGLKQVLRLEIENRTRGTKRGVLKIRDKSFEIEKIEPGRSYYEIEVAEIKREKEVQSHLVIDGQEVHKRITLKPQKRWKIYLLHFSHTDPAYTDLPSRVRKNHYKFLDMVLNFCEATDRYPEESKFRWNIETSYQLQNYLRFCPKEKKDRLVKLIKEKRIELSALYLAHTSELFDNETLIRDTYFARNFCEENGLKMKCAMSSDVTGQAWGLPSILSSYGVRFLSTAVNPSRAKAPAVERPFFWQALDGNSVLVWDTDPKNSYCEGLVVGFASSYEEVLGKLPRYLKRFEDEGYPYDALALRLTGYPGDNTPPNMEISNIARKWNENFEYPKVIVSIASEFFEYMEEKYGRQFPRYKLAWPDWWVDTFGSVAFETGATRKTHTNFGNAEKLLALVKYLDPDFNFPADEIRETCEDLLLADELTTGSTFAVFQPYTLQAQGQAAEISAFTYRAAVNSGELFELGVSSFFSKIKIPADYTIVVFNPLPWERTDIATLPLTGIRGGLKILDFEGKELAYQIAGKSICEWREMPYQTAGKNLIFVATRVPPLGYKMYRLVVAEGETESYKEETGNEIENEFFRVKADKRGVLSIYDRTVDTELVNARNFLFDQFIYEEVEGGRPEWVAEEERDTEEVLRKIDLDFVKYMHETQPHNFPAPQTKFRRSTPTFKCKRRDGRICTSLILEGSSDVFPRIQQEVIIYRGVKRIDVVNKVNKKSVMEPEALYYAFPFSIGSFDVHIECANSVMRPEKDQLPGSCRDWYLVQRWVDISNNDFGIIWSPLEAPLIQLGEINTGKWLDKLETKEATLMSWPMNNYWSTNIRPFQEGEFEFNYSLTTHKGGYNGTGATRFGYGFHFPLICRVMNKQQGVLPARSSSLLKLDKKNVIITTVKKAEDDDSIVIRLRETEGRDCSVDLVMGLNHKFDAYLTNIGEQIIQRLDVVANTISVPINGYSIATIKIERK